MELPLNGVTIKTFKVIGVIKDMIMESPYDPVRRAVYMMDQNNVNWIELKLNPNKSAAESIAKVEAVFKKLYSVLHHSNINSLIQNLLQNSQQKHISVSCPHFLPCWRSSSVAWDFSASHLL